MAGQACAQDCIRTETRGSSHWSHKDTWQLTLALNMQKPGPFMVPRCPNTSIRTAITIWDGPGPGSGLRHSLTPPSSHTGIHSTPTPSRHIQGRVDYCWAHVYFYEGFWNVGGVILTPPMAWAGALLKNVSSGHDPE